MAESFDEPALLQKKFINRGLTDTADPGLCYL